MSEITASSTLQSETTSRSWSALPLGLGLGVLAMLIGAVLWGVIAYFTDTVYFIIPLGIGFTVASALLLPFKKKSIGLVVILFVPSALLTIASALLGDYLYYTLVYAREAAVALPESASFIARNFVEIATESPDTAKSIGLAAVGALLGLINAVRS